MKRKKTILQILLATLKKPENISHVLLGMVVSYNRSFLHAGRMEGFNPSQSSSAPSNPSDLFRNAVSVTFEGQYILAIINVLPMT